MEAEAIFEVQFNHADKKRFKRTHNAKNVFLEYSSLID
jgi:hypothetical protein